MQEGFSVSSKNYIFMHKYLYIIVATIYSAAAIPAKTHTKTASARTNAAANDVTKHAIIVIAQVIYPARLRSCTFLSSF